MSEGTGATDDAGEGLVVCSAIDEGGIVGDVPSIASGSEATGCADLQRAGADGGRGNIGVVAVENEGAGAGFGQSGC